jgi:hypothetical protein
VACRKCTRSCSQLAFLPKPRKVSECGTSFFAVRAWWRVRSPIRFKIPSTTCGSVLTRTSRRTRSSRISAHMVSRSVAASTSATSWPSTRSGVQIRASAWSRRAAPRCRFRRPTHGGPNDCGWSSDSIRAPTSTATAGEMSWLRFENGSEHVWPGRRSMPVASSRKSSARLSIGEKRLA